MKKVKLIPVFLLITVFFISLFSFINIGRMDSFINSSSPVTESDGEQVKDSTIRVLLSAENKTEIKFIVNGNYSIRNGSALSAGTYYIQNSGGNLILWNEARTQQLAAGNPIKIEENQNADTYANFITVYQVGAANSRKYLGSIKFWAHDASYIDAVNHVYLEKYLYGVVPFEMEDNFPIEALKAQAVAARSYAYKYIEGTRDDKYYDLDDTSNYQVYHGFNSSYINAQTAINNTKKIVLTGNSGSVISAYFSASNGGQTERLENIPWNYRPYFQIQDDQYDIDNPASSKEIVPFPMGTSVDKSEDMPTLPLNPSAIGEITGISRIPLYRRPDTGRGYIVNLKRGEKVWIYNERNTAWTKVKVTGKGVGFVPTKYLKFYNLQATVTGIKKKLYDRKSTRGKKLSDLPKNAKVTILSWGSWCLVEYNGVRGYIQKSNLKLSKYSAPIPAANIQPGCEFTVTSTTTLRKTAKSSGKKVSRLSKNARVTLISAGSKWHLVSYNGKQGYIDVKYLQLVIPSLVLDNSVPTTNNRNSTDNIRYTQDDIDSKLTNFFLTKAYEELNEKNKTQPEGAKYRPESGVKIKQITAMKGIQTDAEPHCRHIGHTAANCPSKDYTGVQMSVILKVIKEDAGKEGGIDRVDYIWNFSFKIKQYLESSTYPQWRVFTNPKNLRIFAVEQVGNTFNLINRRWGHGAGLSQRGAQQRAKSSDPNISAYDKILAFYYPGAALTTLNYDEAPLSVQASTAITMQASETPTESASPSPSETVSPLPSETPSETVSPSPSENTEQPPSASEPVSESETTSPENMVPSSS